MYERKVRERKLKRRRKEEKEEILKLKGEYGGGLEGLGNDEDRNVYGTLYSCTKL